MKFLEVGGRQAASIVTNVKPAQIRSTAGLEKT